MGVEKRTGGLWAATAAARRVERKAKHVLFKG
jgi:hypothetical protein